MALTFQLAPLVEIIAELRWVGTAATVEGDGSAVVLNQETISLAPTDEEFFMRFGGECYGQGFPKSERLLPPGFPILPFQVAYRYRPSDPKATELLQIGKGIFSANATPPYQSWDDFEPVVIKGVEALLRTRPEEEKSCPFSGVSLRYIDAFGPDFLQDKSPIEFIVGTLGFSTQLPAPISSHLFEGKPTSTVVSLQGMIDDNLRISVKVGDGTANGQQAVILEIVVSAVKPVSANRDDVLSVLQSGRKVIHDIFVEMTKPLHELMKPIEGKG